MDITRIKTFAKSKIKERFANVFFVTIVTLAVSALAGATYIGVIFAPALTLSLLHSNITFLAGRDVEIKDAFRGVGDWWSAFKVYFLQGLFTSLWSILFIIPGIIKSIAYSQAMYILGMQKGKSARECLRESEQLMKGHKMDYFRLQLSFIGWWILIGLTLGLAAIWVIPYYNATMATFFIDIMPVADDVEAPTATYSSADSSPRKPITFGQHESDDEGKGSNRL